MFEQEEQRDELLEKIEDLISRKRYAELRDLLLPLEAQDIAGLFMELDDKVPMVFRLLPKEQAAEVFVELDSEEQAGDVVAPRFAFLLLRGSFLLKLIHVLVI